MSLDEPGWQPAGREASAQVFQKAVQEHAGRLLAIARAIVGNRASAEDVVQQALMNLYRHRARYDWKEPGGLMRRTVVNEALRVLRAHRTSPLLEDSAGPGGGRENSPVDGLIETETVQQVRQAIDRLPEHFRAALVLCEYENLSYAQIAAALDVSLPQVKTWIFRGRKQLAKMLEGYMEGRRK